nr:transcriptional regulator FilR1 domain-containing protein [Haladaptatus sp. AB618]
MEEPQTLGIGLYDDRKVAVAAYNEDGNGRHIAMIISSNDQLVDWGSELYESYRAKARPASEILLE